MSRTILPPVGGLHLPVSRRSLLGATALLAGAGVLGRGGRPVWAQDVFEEIKPQWTAAQIDWMQQKGKSITIGALQHPWTDAITPLLPHFTRLTGIDVKLQAQSETEYVAEMPVKLGAKNATPDVYMVWALGQSIGAGWLQPLDAMVADKNLTDLAWWDGADVFSSAHAFQKWSDGKQYVMAITAEAQTLFMNKTMLDAKGLGAPRTMDELLSTALALKTADVAGIAMRAKASADAASWPAGGFVFTYGGSVIDPATGKSGLGSPGSIAGVEMYGRLLREAGPIGVGSYHWMECLNDFMAGAVAIGCDSSNFATDIANPEKSTVAGNALYGALPAAGDKPGKPNMWHWTCGMNANSASKEAAWLFLEWATSKPTCALAAAAGLATPRASAWASSAFKDRFGAQAADAALANLKAADGDLFKAAWFNAKGPEILDAFSIAVNETVTGAKPAAQAMADADAKLAKVLG
ncbi:MAG: extracellular solute-binding protein [Geminicoccaceae bacterium]